MQTLPSVLVGAYHYRFPLSAASAGLLADCVFPSPDRAEPGRLSAALAADPPLACWAWLASRQADPPPADLDQLAAWLAGHACELLAASETEQLPLSCPADDPAAQAELVFEDVLRSQLAEAMAREDDPAIAGLAQLLALVARSDRWLPVGWVSESTSLPVGWGSDPTSLPAVRSGQRPNLRISDTARDCVARADDVIAGRAPWPTEIDDGELRARADAARSRWLQPGPSLADQLPAIAARLIQKERDLDERLQRAKIDALAEFAAGAGHEINNPLTVITGRAQLLLRDETDPERRHALALMHAQAMRVHEMIADLRLFARPPRLERKRFDLVALARKAVEELAPAAAERSTSLVYTGDSEPLEIEADPVQLAVVLRALGRNALEAIGQAGHVEIAVRRVESSPSEVAIAVSDDGPGIDPTHRPHIFEPFYSSRQAGRGLGLGLSKTWQIARQHGGRVDVESQMGRGTVVTVRLPQ